MELKAGLLPKGKEREQAIKDMIERRKTMSDSFKDTSDFDTMLKNFVPFAQTPELVQELDRKFNSLCDLLDEPRDRWTIIGREVWISGGSTEGYAELHLATDTRSDNREGFLHLFNAVRRHRAVFMLRSNDMLKFQAIEVKSVSFDRYLSGNPDEYKKEL